MDWSWTQKGVSISLVSLQVWSLQIHSACFLMMILSAVVPGVRVLGFSALPGFRAPKVGDGTWSVHKTLFGFRAPLFQLFIKKIRIFTAKSLLIFALFTAKKLTFCPFCCKKMTFVGGWMVFTPNF